LRFTSKLIAFLVTLTGGALMWGAIKIINSISINIKLAHRGGSFMWFIVPLSTQVILRRVFKAGKYNLSIIDQG